MARWRGAVPARVEPPSWYRAFDLALWDEPDQHEQGMIDGCTRYRCWPDSPDSRWLNWPQWLHEAHARRRWGEAKYRYRREHSLLAEQELQELFARRAKRRDATA